MDVDGTHVELFPSGVLCGMLGRTNRALYKWEQFWGFPRALWTIADDARKLRWYSRRQLIAIRTIYERFGKLSKKDRENLPRFIAAVRAVFYIIDTPIEQRTKP